MGPRADLDMAVKREIPVLTKNRTPVIYPTAQSLCSCHNYLQLSMVFLTCYSKKGFVGINSHLQMKCFGE
jgi:hypothetical protein